MKRLFSIVFLSLAAAASYALPVECVGTATQVVDGKDTVLIFRDEIHLKTSDGQPADWYKGDGSLYASGVDEIYPDEG